MRLVAVVAVAILLLPLPPGAAELEPYDGPLETPALELPDLAGRPHSLDSYRGQVVLVNFWASWCPPCVVEMPGMQRLAETLADRPFQLVAVNFRESRDTVWRFRKLMQVSFTTLLDRSGEAAGAWEVQVYPTSYLIDRQGRIRYVAYGAVDWDAQQTLQRIEALLQEEPASGGQALQAAQVRP